MGDSGCSAGDTHMDARDQWVTVAAVLATHMDKRGQWGDSCCSAGDTHMDKRGQLGDSGCSAGDSHMDKRDKWVTVATVLAIHIWIHVASG